MDNELPALPRKEWSVSFVDDGIRVEHIESGAFAFMRGRAMPMHRLMHWLDGCRHVLSPVAREIMADRVAAEEPTNGQ